MKSHFKLFIVTFVLLPGILLACLWDSKTLEEEIEVNPDLFDLITGQFPSHGTAYYEARVKRIEPLLKKDPKNLEAKNDLAVAYIRLKRFKDAEKTLLELHREKPDEYKYRSNLGVLYKKMGDFELSIKYTESALKIKPEGHLGLGDWYVRMIKWRKEVKELGGKAPTKNFLGWEYKRFDESYEDADKRLEKQWELSEQLEKENLETPESQAEDQETYVELLGKQYRNTNYKSVYVKTQVEYLKKLIKADRHFSDAYVALGDLLLDMKVETFSKKAFDSSNFALWSYMKAIELGHPTPEEIKRRIDAVFKRMHEITKVDDPQSTHYSRVSFEGKDSTLIKIKDGMKKANGWLEHFHEEEAKLVASGKGDTVKFDEVERVMLESNTSRYRPEEDIGISQKSFHNTMDYLGYAINCLILFSVYFILRVFYKLVCYLLKRFQSA